MRVSLEEFEKYEKFKAELNNCPLSEIEWTRDGEVQSVAESVIEEFRFIGLSNIGFPDFAGLVESST